MTLGDLGRDASPRGRRGRALRRLILAVSVAGVLVAGMITPVILGAGLVVNDAASVFLDAGCDVHEKPPPQRSTMYASDGKTLIARFFTQNRAPVHLRDVPKGLVQALIATEDRRFYQHHGVDVRGLVRAAAHDLSNGGRTQGGSTLTMQYVKQVMYYQATTDAQRQAAIAPNLGRKLHNAKCALELERRYTKDQILERYLNIAFFGENSYGIATAAKTYFGEPVARLTVPQGALLVGLLQAPSQYDPFIHPQAALLRRNEVIANMVAVGDLDRATAIRYVRTPLGLDSSRPPPVPEGCANANPAIPNAGFFCEYAVNWLTTHGVTEQELTTGGLHIVSTLNATLQTQGQQAVWRAGLKPTADYILVMPSVDPRTGAVTSMISSRRYGLDGRRNAESVQPLFTAAYAGAGSTYKYFTAASALSAGAPTSFQLTTPGNRYRTTNCASGDYTVRNVGHYPDTMPLRDALPQSSNTYFVAMEDQFFGCRLGPIVDTALKLGLNRLRQPRNRSAAGSIAHEVVRSEEPTFTLGQEPTSALELTGAFSAAANDGVFCPPTPFARITSNTGAGLHLDRPACRRVLSPYVARTLVSLMRRDTHDGTAASYFQKWYAKNGSDVGGKTGTDNNATDNGNSALWFVGSTPHLVAAASLVNPHNPKQTVHDLPHLPGNWVGQDIFGAYASTYWLAAYGPALRHKWTWPSPSAVPGGRSVPSVTGDHRERAISRLRQAGFKVAVFPVPCGSDRSPGTVAYQQPPRANPGAVVTICLSSGDAPYVYVPPPPPPPAPIYRNPSPRQQPQPRPEPRPRPEPQPQPRPKPPPRTKPPAPTLPPIPTPPGRGPGNSHGPPSGG
jgi:membrane peptidoglycan carboxypeptidase